MNQIFFLLTTGVVGAASVLLCRGRLGRAIFGALVTNGLAITAVNSINNWRDVEHNVMNTTWVGITVTGLYFVVLVVLFITAGKWAEANKPANGYGIDFKKIKVGRTAGAFTQNVDQWSKPRESQKAPTSAEARGYKRVNS